MPSRTVVKKFNIYVNGDPASTPQPFTYSNKVVKTWEHLIDDVTTRVVVKGGRVKYLWSTDGRTQISNLTELEQFDEGSLVAGGKYDQFIEMKGGGYESIGRTGLGTKHDKENVSYLERNKKKYRNNSPQKPSITERFDKGDIKKFFVYANGSTENGILYTLKPKQAAKDWEHLMDDLARIAPPTGGAAKWLCTTDGQEVISFDELEDGQHYVVVGNEGFFIPKGGYGGGEIGELSEKRRKDDESLQRHRDKMAATKRSESAKLFNRADQIKPDSLFLFIFRNGNGIESKRFIFTGKQLERGMKWLLEQIARKYSVNPKWLSTMDGNDVASVADLRSKGAYIIVPAGEKFRDTWYYLPDGAIDTSEAAEGGGDNGNSRAVSQASTQRPDTMATTNRDSDYEERDRDEKEDEYGLDRERSGYSIGSEYSSPDSGRTDHSGRSRNGHDPVVAGLMGIRKTHSRTNSLDPPEAMSRRGSKAYQTIGKHINKTSPRDSESRADSGVPLSRSSAGSIRRAISDASLYENKKGKKTRVANKKVEKEIEDFKKSPKLDAKPRKRKSMPKKKTY